MRLENLVQDDECRAARNLIDIAKSLNKPLNLEQLLQVLMDKTRNALKADRCSVFLMDKERSEMWTIVAHGMGKKEIRMPSGRGVVGYIALTGKVLNIKDIYKDISFDREVDRRTGYKTTSILGMPIKDRNGRIIGVCEVMNKKQGCFNKDDERFMDAVVSMPALDIEHKKLYH